ncbi:transcriptional regulator GlxA family with amidase domain [Bradyrhizobium sp. JR7.2]
MVVDAAVVTAVCGSSSISSFARSFQSTRGETPLRSLFQALPFGP